MPARLDPAITPLARPVRSRDVAPAAPALPAQPAAPARGRSTLTTFDMPRPRADGSLVLGRRHGGPGEVTLSKKGELLLNGKRGSGAQLEAARLIEAGFAPFAHATPDQRTALAKDLAAVLSNPGAERKQTTKGPLLKRSAAATLLLSLAQAAPEKRTRAAALNTYIKALGAEPSLHLRKSMLLNLDVSQLEVPTAAATTLKAARDVLLPPRPPYDEWFKGQRKPRLEVRHYVMDEFWKEEVSNWKKRGLEITRESGKTIELRGALEDPTGKNPPLQVHVVLKQDEQNVLRDMDDPEPQMILYSGHSQLGGVIDGSLAASPKEMAGTKLVQVYNCRGKQNQGDFLYKYPGVHLTSTFSSAYGSDDKLVLDATLQTLAARGDYADVNKRLISINMIQGEKNYMLPHDSRNLATRDDDRDGVADLSANGADRFFDPGKLASRQGAHVFSPGALDDDPQELSAVKLSHAVGYANTSFFYFAEANKAAPVTVAQADKLISGGWFSGPASQRVRVTETTKDGQTWYSVSVNSKLASRSREVITSTVLMELQTYLAKKHHGRVTDDDKLRGLMLVGGYLDLYCPYSDTINDVLDGFSKTYGFSGVTYETFYQAAKKDGHDGTATRAALDSLGSHGVKVTQASA